MANSSGLSWKSYILLCGDIQDHPLMLDILCDARVFSDSISSGEDYLTAQSKEATRISISSSEPILAGMTRP